MDLLTDLSTGRRRKASAKAREILLSQPVLQSEKDDHSYIRDVREKQQLISSTLEEAARQTLQMRRPRLIKVGEHMVDVESIVTLPVALQAAASIEEPTPFEWRPERRTSIHEDGDERSDGEYTEVTASADGSVKESPNPADDESVYTEVTLEDEVAQEPPLPCQTNPTPVDRGSSYDSILQNLSSSTPSIMDETLLRSPMALILEKRTRRRGTHMNPYIPESLVSQTKQQLKSLQDSLALKGEDALRTVSMGSSSFDVTVESFLQRHQSPPATPSRTLERSLLTNEQNLAAAGPVPPTSPVWISPTSTKTAKRENTRRSTIVKKSSSSGNRGQSSVERGPASNTTVPVTRSLEVHLPAMVTNPPESSIKAQPPPNPMWSKAGRVAAPPGRPGPVKAASTPKPASSVDSGRPTTIHCRVVRDSDTNRAVQCDGNNTSSDSSNSAGNYAARHRSRAARSAHRHPQQHPQRDARTVVSALTVDNKAYEIKVPLAFDADAILDMLESTSSSSMWDDSDDEDDLRRSDGGNGAPRAAARKPQGLRRRPRRRRSLLRPGKSKKVGGTVRPLGLLRRVRGLGRDPGREPPGREPPGRVEAEHRFEV
jgi:hypothetical protein